MLLLAIDTATSAVTVAVHDGDRVLGEHTEVEARRHAEILTPTIERVMDQAGRRPADFTAIAVGVGPGPFTGLRVGVATAVTLGLALDVPAYGVCSLDAIAQSVRESGMTQDFLVATDARRKEVYWARYRSHADRVERVSGLPGVDRPAELPEDLRALPVAGRGPLLYPDSFGQPLEQGDVDAGSLARFALGELAAGRELLPVQPLYLRQPDAQPASAQKSVLAR
ncbi:tRNA (adenosine(37)-N6)-threonylcarbamoyltransferase complex dimerization subunit type 1 TsaB [Flexivirga meconopsidis]|uniref:tRNA (adenosine(37)-N6)-threonylcarbamoyltransferase complex dimerization subunit type 1 TsaB n=1 Tax=Flexivirga meconopsidis TaxID=2977121 RepID=UPI00224090A9